MENNVMWIWWALTVAICAWKIVEGLWQPHRMLEWPFLASAMWAYFYGYMAYDAKTTLPEYLGNGISNIGQCMPLLCLVAILLGWGLGTRKCHARAPESRAYPYFRFWLAGMFFLLVGAAGAYSVMRAAASGNLNYSTSSGYWILLFYVGYPGLAITVWAMARMDATMRRYFVGRHPPGLCRLHVSGIVINARRGPLFPALMVLLLVPPLAMRRSPNPFIFCGGLAVLAVVMMTFLQVRSVIYSGGSWSEALRQVDITAAVAERSKEAEDNEYVNNCQLIGTIYSNGKYQYGTGHLQPSFPLDPARDLERQADSRQKGAYSFDEMFDDVEAATGYRLLGTGAAAGGVADTFVQYGVFCPGFWFLLSWAFGAVYRKGSD